MCVLFKPDPPSGFFFANFPLQFSNKPNILCPADKLKTRSLQLNNYNRKILIKKLNLSCYLPSEYIVYVCSVLSLILHQAFFCHFPLQRSTKLMELLIIFFSRRCEENEAYSLDLPSPMARQLSAHFVGQSECVNHGI